MLNNNIINSVSLVNFVSRHAYNYVGMIGGKETTLSDEMSMIAKAIAKADVCRIAVDPYRTRLAYSLVEMTEDEKLTYAEEQYRKAGRKILWLNTICRSRTGFPFVVKRIDPNSLEDIERLVNDFEAAIRFAAIGN